MDFVDENRLRKVVMGVPTKNSVAGTFLKKFNFNTLMRQITWKKLLFMPPLPCGYINELYQFNIHVIVRNSTRNLQRI